ncbi:MAG: hypothetical protein Q9160_000612 [Pyrenula sp. 1 TL-2023]
MLTPRKSTASPRSRTGASEGRVLLAGDAAYIRGPLGSQGLNVGTGDNINSGWKLAATIRRESACDRPLADLALLDPYESEHHPVGAWVLEWTRAQVSTLQPDLHGAATQALVRNLINTTDRTNFFIDQQWGLSGRYPLDEDETHAHPLVGCSAPDSGFNDDLRLGPKLVSGRGLLVEFEDDAALKESVVRGKHEDKVEYLGMGAKGTYEVRASLIRPDGVVAWVVEDHEPDIDALNAASEQWFEF